jgi:Fe-S-cluster-containing dehydrogenase component
MAKFGLMIDYEFCVGCRVCELACQKEHDRPIDEYGICVKEVKPEISGGKQYFFPFPTDKCNLCGKRIAKGQKPACVHNCWADVMRFGKIEELAEHMKGKPRTVLWVPH